MTILALCLSVISLVAVIVLGFGYSALLRSLQDLQSSIAFARPADRRPIRAFAGSHPSVVVAVDRGCSTCIQRINDLNEIVESTPDATVDFHVLGGGLDGLSLAAPVHRLADPDLLGDLRLHALPAGLVFDRDGREIHRSVLGDRKALTDLIDGALELGVTGPEADALIEGTRR